VSTTVIPFNNKRPANDAAATLAMPAETVDLRLPRDYYLPRGMPIYSGIMLAPGCCKPAARARQCSVLERIELASSRHPDRDRYQQMASAAGRARVGAAPAGKCRPRCCVSSWPGRARP
jgi:hypothetical protein